MPDKKDIKILIAEDEVIIALDITSTLNQIGYMNVLRVQSGEMLLEKFKSEKPALIISDIMLKGELNGIDAAKKIKNIKDIPIIFIAGFGDKNFHIQASQISPNGLISKPFDSHDLKEKIESFLNNQ